MRSIFAKVLLLLAALLLVAAPARAQESKSTDETKSADSAKSADSSKPAEVAKAIIPVFRLSGSISETPSDETFPFSTEHSHSLKDLVERMHKARDDKNVKAV